MNDILSKHLLPRSRWHYRLATTVTALARCLPAELAHDLAMICMERGWCDYLLDRIRIDAGLDLRTKINGLGDLLHPVGLAAGLDKDARAVRSFAKIGFSFLELGTVTPRPQPGNPKPRMFRLPQQNALVNRMGFNSQGIAAMAQRLKSLDWDHTRCPLGINIGKNKDTKAERAADDYMQCFNELLSYSRYIVLNLSSPNTPGLRDLASLEFLQHIAALIGNNRYRVWIKLDPDMPREPFQTLVEEIASLKFQGVILTNTHRLDWPETGGLSGAPLAAAASQRLDWAMQVHRGELATIAVGGICSGYDVFNRLARGASATQIYSALVYRGPWAVALILLELVAEMKLHGYKQLSEIRDHFG